MGTLTPAYGRDYKSVKELQVDFDANKDFVLNSFKGNGMINKEQLIDLGVKSIQVRYKNHTATTIIKID